MWFWTNNVLFNLLPFAIVGASLGVVLRSRREPLWAEAYRRLRRNPLAVAAMAVIAIYGLVALMDSVGWMKDRNANRVTAIDVLFKRQPERTFSAPLARWTTGEPKPVRLRRGTCWGRMPSARMFFIAPSKECGRHSSSGASPG